MICKRPARKGAEYFPCGQCVPCRINRSRVWVLRLLLELELHSDACFLTLTYNEEHYPAGGNLVPRDLQLFLKRLRYNLPGRDIRYFAVGEYGEARGRPHYHLILFGVGKQHLEAIEKSWNLGFSYVGDVTVESARYVAGYVIKGWTKDRVELEGRHPEFARMSRRPALGFRQGAAVADALRNHKLEVVPAVVKVGRQSFPLGRTMRNKVREHLTGVIGELPEETLARRARLQALREGASPHTVVGLVNDFDRADAIELRAYWRRKGDL